MISYNYSIRCAFNTVMITWFNDPFLNIFYENFRKTIKSKILKNEFETGKKWKIENLTNLIDYKK